MNRSSHCTLLIALLAAEIASGQAAKPAAAPAPASATATQSISFVNDLVEDYKDVQKFLYGFQDKFGGIPGDLADVARVTGCKAPCKGGNGNGKIDGRWDSTDPADESWQLWLQVRASGLGRAPLLRSDASDTTPPKNARGGRVGATSNLAAQAPIAGMSGETMVCSARIPGKVAKEIDRLLDDGHSGEGSVRAVPDGSPPGTTATTISAERDADLFTVCLVF